MIRPSTRQGTDYRARDYVGDAIDSESRGSDQKALGNDQVPNGEPRSRSSSRESNKSGARASPRGSPTPAGASRREIGVKKEDMFVVDTQSAMELAKLKLNNGLKELAIIAPTTREAVVAVAGQNMPKFMERPFLLEMGVPKDCVDKVIQVYQSSFGHILSRDIGRDESTRQNDRRNRGDDALSGRGSRRRDSQRESRHSNEERVNRAPRGQFHGQESSQGFRETRRSDRESRGRDLPVWMNNTLKNLSYDGSTEWETFIHRFRLISDQMGLRDPERAEFLVSTLQGDAFKAIMYAQRAKGELNFHEICSRLESRYEGDFSTPAAAWMKLDQAFQQRNESLFQWSDRLNRIGDSIFRLDVGGRNSIETRLVSKFCFAARDRETGVKTMEQGPPKTLEEAVESMRWFQHVQGAAANSGAERPRAHVRGWSPDRDSWDRYNKGGDMDSRYERYRESPRPTQQYSAYPSRSRDFGRYEGSPRADDSRDRERVRDSQENYQVRAVSGGWETAMAELTKQVGGLVQEVRGIKTRLDSIDSRLSKVEAWEGRLAAVEQQLRDRARSPVRRRSPSPGSKCFSCGGEGHYRSECPRPPTVTFEDQFRCWECGEGGHSRASCPRSRSRSTSPKGQGN